MAVDANFSADPVQAAIGHKPLEARDTKKAVTRAPQEDLATLDDAAQRRIGRDA
jgi:hypothetical protein